MEKEKAIQKFLEFKTMTGISRDKAIEVYGHFKINPTAIKYTTFVNGDVVCVEREEFWDNINTSIIKELYKKGKVECEEMVNEDEPTSTDYTKLRKETLKYKNKLNFERKAFNKKLTEINGLEELNKELINAIKELPKKQPSHFYLPESEIGVGVICISDTHFNELIDTPNNKYDFEIASRRLKKLAVHATKHFINNSVNRVVVMFLGDLLNSDRRQSEYMNMVTNRSKAMVLAFYILKQFIQELNEYFDITIASVSGNESRVVGEEYDTSEEMATYNYDYTLHQFLKVYFEDNKTIQFIDGNFGEKVININGQNVIMTHGVALKNDLEKSVTQTFGRYGSNGVPIDYLFCGHLHSARVGDTCARCGSLCGGNSYSEGALNLNSRASQLIGIFYNDKTRNIMNVDLHNADNFKGYEIVDKLESYNAKSTSKKNKFLIHNIQG